MQKSRIILTNQQLDFAATPDFPLIKHAIIQNIVQLFEQAGAQLQLNSTGLEGMDWKITRGENYLQMPYVVLDYPKIHATGFGILLRTMFWWGHYFSLNLIIRKDLISSDVIELDEPVYVLMEDDLWNNDIRKGYVLTSVIDPSTIKGEYLRICTTLNIVDYEQLTEKHEMYSVWLKNLRGEN